MASYLKESLRQALEAVEKRERAQQPEERLARPPAPPKPPPTAAVRPRGIPLTPSAPPPRSEPAAPRVQAPMPPSVKAPAGVAVNPGTPGAPKPAPQKATASVAATVSAETFVDRRASSVSLRTDREGEARLSPMAMAFERPVIAAPPPTRFRPVEPKDLDRAGLEASFVDGLILKYLLAQPGSTGRQVAQGLAVHWQIVRELLADLKEAKLVVLKRSTATGDFRYELTMEGRANAYDLQKHSRYVGPAPVPFDQWLMSVHEQSIANEKPRMGDLYRAFQDLLVTEELLQQLGPAMTSGKGLFLFGFPGNGKTSLAERMTRAFGTSVYLPHAVLIDGHLVKVFDPMVHEPLKDEDRTLNSRERVDPRWVKCRRPTVVVGGELTMDSLELDFNPKTGICEAPIQVKAACGTLVIDDFGRQRVEPATLLNRWIVPLEQRVDFLRLPDGRKVEVPFDPLLVFSTNLDPKDLCDEAFLRRIPYKVNVEDPSEDNFRKLLHIQAELLGFEPDDAVFDYVIETHYRSVNRNFRNCHPRDLMLQIQNQCLFREQPHRLSREGFDEAAGIYFTLL
ncbi:MAG: AAA family ATPase [Myxococcota bacterium]|nr:AAA family ATPase [Myxococcota bacterium]